MKMCEERRNLAPPGYCHSNASGDKDHGEGIPREASDLGKGEAERVQRTLPLASQDLNSSPSSGADSSE